jgi:hypothetical protein
MDYNKMTFTGDQIICTTCGKPINMNNAILEPLCICNLSGILTTFAYDSD